MHDTHIINRLSPPSFIGSFIVAKYQIDEHILTIRDFVRSSRLQHIGYTHATVYNFTRLSGGADQIAPNAIFGADLATILQLVAVGRRMACAIAND